MKKILYFILLSISFSNLVFSEETEWHFIEVTNEVVDVNPPGLGRIFDFAMVDINDDHLLDIVVNNHDHKKCLPKTAHINQPDSQHHNDNQVVENRPLKEVQPSPGREKIKIQTRDLHPPGKYCPCQVAKGEAEYHLPQPMNPERCTRYKERYSLHQVASEITENPGEILAVDALIKECGGDIISSGL